MYQDCPESPPGNCFGDSFPCVFDSGDKYCTKPQHRPTAPLPILQAGQWYCFEQMLDMGTPTPTEMGANGHLTLWRYSQLLGDFQDLWIRTTANLKIQNLWLSLFHHDAAHSVVGELIDNVVVSTQRVGGGAAQSPPGPPANLRVIS